MATAGLLLVNHGERDAIIGARTLDLLDGFELKLRVVCIHCKLCSGNGTLMGLGTFAESTRELRREIGHEQSEGEDRQKQRVHAALIHAIRFRHDPASGAPATIASTKSSRCYPSSH